MRRSAAIHVPVLPREVLAQLDLHAGLVVVDGTVGAGGHSREILSRIRPGGRLIGVDRDPMMLDLARQSVSGQDVELVHSTYQDLRTVLDGLNISTVDRVLLDLGLSSDQLADRSRGFGFDAGGPLDMRFDATSGVSAAEWLAQAPEAELQRVLEEFGDPALARPVARTIAERRRTQPIRTAEELSAVVEAAIAGKRGRRGHLKDALAPVFQAIRIAVNSELTHLSTFLREGLPQCLPAGGRAAIITFHSVEDRMVKQALRPEQGWTPVTRKPIEPTPAEMRVNPRSRSARLRVAVRAATTPGGA